MEKAYLAAGNEYKPDRSDGGGGLRAETSRYRREVGAGGRPPASSSSAWSMRSGKSRLILDGRGGVICYFITEEWTSTK
jgi:hypothetical protein